MSCGHTENVGLFTENADTKYGHPKFLRWSGEGIDLYNLNKEFNWQLAKKPEKPYQK